MFPVGASYETCLQNHVLQTVCNVGPYISADVTQGESNLSESGFISIALYNMQKEKNWKCVQKCLTC